MKNSFEARLAAVPIGTSSEEKGRVNSVILHALKNGNLFQHDD